jgi:hypothetical protein
MTNSVARDTARQVLALPLPEGNDADAATVRDYLTAQLVALWREGDGFSGKRPLGNSGWEWDIYIPMAKAGLIHGEFDEDGEVIELHEAVGERLIVAAINELGRPS